MSTTSTFQGMDVEAKPSSRVLAPPGGGSSNIFGGCTDDAPKKAAPARNQSDVLNQGPPKPATPSKKPAAKIAYNPITGQPYEPVKKTSEEEEEKKEEEAKEASGTENKAPEDTKSEGAPSDNFKSTRVSQPPGGRSSKLW